MYQTSSCEMIEFSPVRIVGKTDFKLRVNSQELVISHFVVFYAPCMLVSWQMKKVCTQLVRWTFFNFPMKTVD